MEILIVAMIMTVVVKRGVEDVWHTARGGTPPRLAAAKARRQSGAAGRYWGQLWDDTWSDLLTKHNDRRSPAASSRPRGAARVFLSNLWRDGWVAAERRRSSKATRPRPGQETVPGEVVPDARDGEPPMYVKDGRHWGNCDRCGKRMVLLPYQTTCAWCTYQRFGGDSNPDAMRLTTEEAKRWTAGRGPSQDEDRPQDGDGTGPTSVLDEDQDGTGPEDGTVPQDEDGDGCPGCGGPTHVPRTVCLRCQAKQEQRNQHYEDQSGPDSGPDQDITPPATPTTEGPTMTTMPTGEVSGLSDMINFCESSTVAFKAQIHATELSIAAAAAGGVTGPGAAKLAHAMELCTAAAAAYDEAAVEYKSHVVVQEAYDAVPGAGTREFVTAGR